MTHNIDEALKLGNRILIMSNGVFKDSYEIYDKNRDLLSDKFIDLKRKIIESIKE